MTNNYHYLPIHPFLFVLFLILSVFITNIQILYVTAPITPIMTFFSLIFIILIFSFLIKKNYRKTGLFLTIFLFLNYCYYPLCELISSFFPISVVFQIYGIIFLIFIALLISSFWFLFKADNSFIVSLTHKFNIISIFLLIIFIATNFHAFFSINNMDNSSSNFIDYDNIIQNISLSSIGERDYYFIILDRYPGSETLQEFYGFDNHQFIEELSDRGFLVIQNSRSNYGETGLSLPSMLNMDYLLSSTSSEKIIEDNLILRYFNALNFTTVHVSSNWITTQNNSYADIIVNQYGIDLKELKSEMLADSLWKITLIDRTLSYQMYYVIRVYLLGLSRPSSGIKEINKIVQSAGIDDMQEYINGTFTNVTSVSKNTDKTYTFAHINGWEGFCKDNCTYVETVQSINNIVIKTIDEIQSNSASDPVIVIISDHGIKPDLSQIEKHKKFINNWTCIPNYTINEGYLSNMNYLTNNFQSLCLPDGGNEYIHQNITPVNIFRIIFNYYFNTSFEILEDKSFWRSKDGFCEI